MENRKLKNGYTTGSCAAAAAAAAAFDFCGGGLRNVAGIALPDGSRREFAVEKQQTPFCCYRVRKDAGDDPDVTDKVYVYASCRSLDLSERTPGGCGGKGYMMEGEPRIYINGGPGIGVATKEGLPCPVGYYAINPVPREEIAMAVREACADCAGDGAVVPDALLITISIPEGADIAKRTFNPRLGITGGISVLGTSGIVRPMSEEAVLDTIRLELHMRAAQGMSEVILTPGNYGETFLKERLGIPEGNAVIIGNFVRDSVVMACGESFKKIILAGHTGKLIKVAAGFANTHSRYGDRRMETFLSVFNELLAGGKIAPIKDPVTFSEKIKNANTTDEALDILSVAFPEESSAVVETFLDETALAVKRQLDAWTEKKVENEVIVFSRAGCAGATESVKRCLTR